MEELEVVAELYDYAPIFQLFVQGLAFGFAGSLFAGLVGWSISAASRLFIKMIGGR